MQFLLNPNQQSSTGWTPTLQEVTDVGATTTNTTTFSPSGNNKAIIANGSGSGIGIDITHSGSGTKLNIGAGGSGDAIVFDTDKFKVNDDWDISSSLFTASRALATNANKEIVTSATTATELGYLSGVTSAIQTQLNGKQATLVSGTNIKTINGTTLLGSGDMTISASPGWSNTQVQFNDWGAFWGDAGFTYDKTTDTVTLTKTALASTPTSSAIFQNTTAATTGSRIQVSPATQWSARGWNSGGSTSQSIDFRSFVLPETGASGAHGFWKLQSSRNWASYVDLFTVNTRWEAVLNTQSSGIWAVTGFQINVWFSNTHPNTSRPLRIENSGSSSFIDFNFSGTLRSAMGFINDWEARIYSSWGSGFALYTGNAGFGSPTLYSYSTPSTFVHYQQGRFGGSVIAGSSSQAPTSTLQSLGSVSSAVKYITTNTTLDATASTYIAEPSGASCIGTPSAACSSWTNQTDCEKWDAHGGCVWNTGSPCDIFNNEYGMGTCSTTSGCSVSTSSCAGASDQSSCEAQDDAYGGSCSWGATGDCSTLDEGTCWYTSGCTQNFGDCSLYSDGGWDGSACYGYNAACLYDSMTGACSGTPFLNCSGTYDTCSGDFYNGVCNGTYGAGCSGTATCSGIDDSTNCWFETGCTWTAALTVTLPDIDGCIGRDYYIYNASSASNDVIVVPTWSDSVNHTTSYTLWTYKDFIHVKPFKRTGDCGSFTSEETCTPTGCSVNMGTCSWNTEDSTCSGNAVCTSIGDQITCEATTYFSYCSGTYTISSNWYVIGR